MVLHNPNNWHWVNRDVSVWAREYLDKNLITIAAEQDGVSAKIDKIISMDGDVDVSQRKGKVITLFDVVLKTEYSGKTKDGEDVSGTITVPEVAHDTEEDEYVVCFPSATTFEIDISEGTELMLFSLAQFEIDIYSETPSKQPVKDLVRTKITPQLRASLQKLAPALISEHGKYLQHAPDQNPGAAPKNVVTSSTAKQATAKPSPHATTSSTKTNGPSINTTTVTSSEEFRTTASELYQTFTDPQRIAAFTRAPPKVFEGVKPGAKFELFGGNVSGAYVRLDEPKQIVQKWRLAQWPEGHFSELNLEFDQNDVDAVTVMRVEWTGVPVGQEEVTRRNWGEYYVRSIKTTFG